MMIEKPKMAFSRGVRPFKIPQRARYVTYSEKLGPEGGSSLQAEIDVGGAN